MYMSVAAHNKGAGIIPGERPGCYLKSEGENSLNIG
jgi:hypothetical protein